MSKCCPVQLWPLPFMVLQTLTVWSLLPEARKQPSPETLPVTAAEKHIKTTTWTYIDFYRTQLQQECGARERYEWGPRCPLYILPSVSSYLLKRASSPGCEHQDREWISSSCPRKRCNTSPFLLTSISTIIPSLYLHNSSRSYKDLSLGLPY